LILASPGSSWLRIPYPRGVSVLCKSVLRTSVIEFPGHIADVVFVGGCNFRCPYCYNRDLVLNPGLLPDLPAELVFEDVKGRRCFVDGIVITGGEPSLQPELDAFLTRAREANLLTKLDTNGYRPDVLRRCLEKHLVSYIAMDVKTSLPRYRSVAGLDVDHRLLLESISLILSSGVEHEFRTTVVPGLVELSDVEAISREIRGAQQYYLQAFRPSPTVGWGNEVPVGSPDPELMQQMARVASRNVHHVGVRGLVQGDGTTSREAIRIDSQEALTS